MDTNWCTVCSQHIDFSDTDLYCSQECRKIDELPQVVPAYITSFISPSPSSSITPSPTLTFSFSPASSSRPSPSNLVLDQPRCESTSHQASVSHEHNAMLHYKI